MKITVIPVVQLPGYVRLWGVTAREFPDDSDRVFATDYTTATNTAGVPRNVQANDFPSVSNISNYYVQPHVPINEITNLWKNWRYRKIKTIKVGPGIPIKPITFTSRLTNYSFSDLNYGGYGTPAAVPKNAVHICYETVGANVLYDSSSVTDTSVRYGPGYFKCIFKTEKEFVYRPFWEHAPSIHSNPTVLSVTANAAGLKGITNYPMKFFGVPATVTQHGTNSFAVAGANSYTTGNVMDGSAFFEQPIRLPDWNPTATGYAMGGFDEGFSDKGQGVSTNALKTALT